MPTGFDTRAGTRGVRPTSNPVGRWLERQMAHRWVRALFRAVGMGDTVVLTTIGHRTGSERSARVCCFRDDAGWLVVAAAGGTATNPAWYYNLAADPDQAWVEVDGRTVAVTAQQLHGAERDAAWRKVTAATRQFAWFQTKTDRVLPVIRLVPRGTEGVTAQRR